MYMLTLLASFMQFLLSHIVYHRIALPYFALLVLQGTSLALHSHHATLAYTRFFDAANNPLTPSLVRSCVVFLHPSRHIIVGVV